MKRKVKIFLFIADDVIISGPAARRTTDRKTECMMDYDVLIIGAGPGGIFTAYELTEKTTQPLKVAVFELGRELDRRKCPIDGEKIRSCIRCKTCSIMSGFGGAGAFSDGKYNITNDFGGSLTVNRIVNLVLHSFEKLNGNIGFGVVVNACGVNV